MALPDVNMLDGLILKQDLYKDNTLLLKKGSVLNSYILNKLNNFGYYAVEDITENSLQSMSLATASKEVALIQNDKLRSLRNREILKFAGFSSESILLLDSAKNITKNPFINNISYIFIDFSLFTEEFLQELTLLNTKKKIRIFVMNTVEEAKPNLLLNTDYLEVKFLYRPLANNYIKALLRLYS